MTEFPEPLVPQDTDLRAFDYMPLKVAQLRDSDLAAIATDGEFRAAVMLWCAAWHQVPASSLPADDRMLCRLAGLGRDMRTWQMVHDVALKGFIRCSDGRLYHPLIADLAIVASKNKKRNVDRTRNATEARRRRNGDVTLLLNQRNDDRGANVTSTKGEGEGYRKGNGKERIPPLAPQASDERHDFDAVVKSWNLLAIETLIPEIQHLTETRKIALRLRLKEIGGLEGWYSVLDKIRAGPHLTGRNDRGWTATFDWVLKPANLTKIMEGNYDDRHQPPKPGSLADSFIKVDAVIDELDRRENGTGQNGDKKNPVELP
jgi:hypothetical protein